MDGFKIAFLLFGLALYPDTNHRAIVQPPVIPTVGYVQESDSLQKDFKQIADSALVLLEE